MSARGTIGSTVSLLALLAAGGVAVAAGFGPGAGFDRPVVPKPSISASAETVEAGGTFDVIADFELADKVKLYREKLQFTWTKLEGAKFQGLVLPEPELARDPITERNVPVYTKKAKVIGRLIATGKEGDGIVVEGKLHHQSCTSTVCFPPAAEAFTFRLTVTEAKAVSGPATPPGAPEGEGAADTASQEDTSVFWQIILAFFGGITLALTPCVYPMIPVTAAVIGARKEKGFISALLASCVYVLGLAIVYALIGLLVARPESNVQSFLQRPYVLIPVSAIFVALAVVMFAGLNFAAPTAFASKLQGMLAGKKGILSTFALGAVSGLIAGPCVAAPLAGVLIYIAKTGDSWLGYWMLFALGWGMGIPLIVFGTATGLLPKAGPWMEWTKRLLGFVLLWAAVYFLRAVIGATAYQVCAALVLIAAAAFLGGFDLLTRESTFVDRLKKVLGVAAVMYAAVLIFNAFVMAPGTAPGADSGSRGGAPAENLFKPATANDVREAIAAGKPVVLDFYADWCDICKVLDENVYAKPEALEAAKGLAAFKIDVDKEKGLKQKYEVFGPPSVVFIGPDGTVRNDLSFAGKKSLDEFLDLLRRFKK